MSVSDKHPLYDEFLPDWDQMDDTYKGERTVKEAGTVYLPATSGMKADGMNEGEAGQSDYDAYRTRAIYHDFVKDAVTMMVDIMHRKPAEISLPKAMEPLREQITSEGHSINALMREISFNQLKKSRLGLLAEAPKGQGPRALPFLAVYTAQAITNWKTGETGDDQKNLDFLILDESEQVANGFSWQNKDKFRVLLAPESEQADGLTTESQGNGFWNVPVEGKDGDVASADAVRPHIGGNSLDYIPFTFINADDLNSEPEPPVLIGLSNLTLAIYRGEADYRQTLFQQGQDTLVIIGAELGDEDDEGGKTRVGTGSKIEVGQGGDAKMIGSKADGLSEQRLALDTDKTQAAERGARLLDFGDTSRQSGDALRIRVAARTTTLRTIALNGAEGLQQSLRQIAEWVGANPKEVIVKPNLDFTDDAFTGQDVLEYMQAKAMGAPLSLQSIHAQFRKRDLTEMTFEQEMEVIDGEKSLTLGTVLDIRKEEGDKTKDKKPGKGKDPRQKTQDGTPGPNTTTDN